MRFSFASLVVMCSGAQQNDICNSHHGIECTDHDVAGYKTGVWTSEACCKACQDHAGCRAWSWNFKDGHCHLKDACSKPTSNADYHSGSTDIRKHECVDAVNKYRKMAGKPALPACDDKYFDVTHEMACYDINNAHASVQHEAKSFCPGGDWSGQNEGAPKFHGASCTWDDEVKCWYDESDNGPGASGCCKPCTTCNKGHYKNLIANVGCVACSFCESGSGWQWTANFCRASSLSGNETMVVV